MKQFNKTYENVFSTDIPKIGWKLYLEKISLREMELNEYTLLFKNFLQSFYLELFNGCVRLSWLRRHFKYYGIQTKFPINKNSPFLNSAFVKFLRREVGMDIQLLTRGKFFSKLELYFDELFPGFDDGNPFENPDYYKYPFKNISIDFLIPVHQLEDRIALLKFADEQKMSYATFLDYVINHVYCLNDEIGRDRFKIRLSIDRNFPFYVMDTDKKLAAKKGKKRV